MHHKATGHMTRDQVFVPKTRSSVGLPPKAEDPEDGETHSLLEEAPLALLFRLVLQFTLGWPGYLLLNLSGQEYGRWTSHFHIQSPIFQPHQAWDVIVSDFGMAAMIAGLVYASTVTSLLTVTKYYIVPYLIVNFWLVLITYLQHTDPNLPHYREGEWNFQRGAACTVDRSYGWLLDHSFHHIGDSHVAHHYFSNMPHWNAVKATPYIKDVLGEHYRKDDTAIPIALWRSFTQCRFVEDTGDVVLYQK
jgi:omega-6 fatty acid desaturase (delta-12 desaturase)